MVVAKNLLRCLMVIHITLIVDISGSSDHVVGNPVQSELEDQMSQKEIRETFRNYSNVLEEVCRSPLIILRSEDSDVFENDDEFLSQARRRFEEIQQESCRALNLLEDCSKKWEKLTRFDMYQAFEANGINDRVSDALILLVEMGEQFLEQTYSEEINKNVNLAKEVQLRIDQHVDQMRSKESNQKTIVDQFLDLEKKWFSSVESIINISFSMLMVTICFAYVCKIVIALIRNNNMLTIMAVGFLIFLSKSVNNPSYMQPLDGLEQLNPGDRHLYDSASILIRFGSINWRRLPMTDGSWKRLVAQHRALEKIGKSFEQFALKIENFNPVNLVSKFATDLVTLNRNAWLVKNEYPLIREGIMTLQTNHRTLQHRLQQHIKNRIKFVGDLRVIFEIGTLTAKELIDHLINTTVRAVELDEKLAEISKGYQAIGNDIDNVALKTMKEKRTQTQKRQESEKLAALGVVGSFAACILFPIMVPVGLLAAGTFAIKGTEHLQHEDFLQELRKVLERYEEDQINVEKSTVNEMHSLKIMQSELKTIKRLANKYGTLEVKIDRHSSLAFYLEDFEEACTKYVEKLKLSLKKLTGVGSHLRLN